MNNLDAVRDSWQEAGLPMAADRGAPRQSVASRGDHRSGRRDDPTPAVPRSWPSVGMCSITVLDNHQLHVIFEGSWEIIIGHPRERGPFKAQPDARLDSR